MQKTKQTPQDFQTVESQADTAPTQIDAPASGPQRGPLGEPPSKLPVVGIGASAGGLAALKLLLPQIPPDSGVAFVLVVHLSPDFKSQLAELLQPFARLTVQQVVGDVPLEPNHIYVIPPNRNLNTIDSHLRLSPLEEQRRERAPIDHFFRTLAKTHNGNSVGIVLTGTGADGTLGVQEIKAQGGLTIAQDPVQAEYDGMPRSAVATGMIDFVLPLEAMVERALRFLHTRPRVPIMDEADHAPSPRSFLPRVFALVRARTGNDFGHYKQSTILRRIRRRMQLAHVEELEDYLAILRSQPEEVQALAEDFLITVTNFFRDTAVFDYIEREVVPQVFAHKSTSDTVRVWSVGCSTGEEAYSLAMLLLEQASRREGAPEIQIFASDLHERSLGKARQGVYPEDIETDVAGERLKRFFIKESGCYRLRKEVRDLVVFAPHNVLSDPPFSRIDLILCRNVLIYLQRDVQSDLIDLFHYALNSNGWLVVGTAESVEGTEQFVAQSKKQGCYRKRNVPQFEPRLPVFPLVRGVANAKEPVEPRASLATYGAMHQRMVERFAPPSILVSPEHRVVHFSQNAGRYMLQPGGAPTTNVFKLVREELHLELRAALQATKDGAHAYTSNPVAVKLDGKCRHVSLYARQCQGAESALQRALSETDKEGKGQPHQEEEDETKGFHSGHL